MAETNNLPTLLRAEAQHDEVELGLASGLLRQAANEIDSLHSEVERLKGENAGLMKRAEVRAIEVRRARAQFDAVVARLSHIYGLIHGDDVVVLPDGRRFKFHPPEEHVRAAWEGLSKAIREIPSAIDAALNPSPAAQGGEEKS